MSDLGLETPVSLVFLLLKAMCSENNRPHVGLFPLTDILILPTTSEGEGVVLILQRD